MRNYLALLGWGADDYATLISTEELVTRFRVADVGKAAAIFDEKKLRWINGRYMREMPLDDYVMPWQRTLGARPTNSCGRPARSCRRKRRRLRRSGR